MRSTLLAGLALAALLTATEGSAQDRWALEIRGSGAFPTADIADNSLETGFGVDATVHLRVMPHLAVYGGWAWTRFSPDQSFAGADMDFEETGYTFGLRFEHPFTAEVGAAAGWVRVGGTYDHVEIEDLSGDLMSDTGHGLGWEVGAGLALGVGPSWSLTPGVRYRSLSRDAVMHGATTAMDLRYVSVEFGLLRRF